MDILERASNLLRPFMAEERRDTWLTLAFHGEHHAVYDSIKQGGATADLAVRCVRTLLDRGTLGQRHALSHLLEVVRKEAGDEKQAEFQDLIATLDARCVSGVPDAACPYRGLGAFQEEDAPYFFGRDAFTRELIEAVDRQPFVAIIGPSGSGKSSVAQAGLIPALRSRGTWEFGILRPGPEPWRSLAGCLLDLLQGEPSASEELKRLHEVGELAAALSNGRPGGAGVGLKHVVARILRKRSGIARLLLLVDQWEELYTYQHGDPLAASRFADVLIDATESAPLTVVLTLRADFTGQALKSRALRDRLQKASVMLGPMTRAELEEAITGPAQQAGLGFQPGLVGRILDDVGDEPGNLPLLEFCLTQLYARSQGGPMCQAAYEAIGGVRGAIVHRADSVIDEMEARDPGREAVARDVFLQLVQLGEGSEDTRRRAPLGDFDETAPTLITHLASERLVVTGRDPGSEQETVEVAHEALIRNWQRLRGWLRQDRDDLDVRREIQRAAAAWAAHGEAYRWSDERVVLETAPVLRRLASRFALNEAERRFLGPVEAHEMLGLLQDPTTPHAQRSTIGDRLTLLPGGDPRPGIGLRADGLPDIVWQPVPGGEVELEITDAGPLPGGHRFLVEPFHLARHPVTVAQWRPFLAAEDGYDALVRQVQGWEPDSQRARDNQPVVVVTWVEAMAYCQWLSARLGHEVRLPTEWEWQQAATSGHPDYEYPWGTEWEDGRANTYESGLGRIAAVGLYPHGVSAQGVLDLAGNVWECCLNKYDKPEDKTEGGEDRRVVRGGSWLNGRGLARCACRSHLHPDDRLDVVGFRLVCVSSIP
jgi:formylglycine-generating enzyme required for sulfatase activity